MANRRQSFGPGDVSKQALLQGVALSPDGETAGRPDRRIDRLGRIVDWFGRHL